MKLLAILLLLPLSAAAESCPWLNAATAGGVLGSAATLTVTHENANRDDAACIFASASGTLRISVQTMETPRSEFTSHAAACGANTTPLKAIGNEAVVCDPDKLSAQAIGRVRNRIFVILINTADTSAAAAVLREKARSIAEQVAGNLF
jgi:hypothetical protein